MLGQHLRTWREAVHDECAQQQRHRSACRHSERNRRNQVAAFLGIVRTLRGDDPANIALTEVLGVLFGADRVTVRHPVDHCGAKARHRAQQRAKAAATQHQPPVPARIANTVPLRALLAAHSAIGARDARAFNRHLGQFWQRENAERDWHERQVVPQIQ
jgi:hypothetical protein